MSLLGAALLFGGSAMLFLYYKSYLSASERECRGYLSLIEFLEGRVSCYLSPINEAVLDFESEVLFECGFLKAAREVGLKEAFAQAKQKSRMPSDAVGVVEELFSGLGRGYLDSEVRAMDLSIKKLRRICEREAAQMASRVKIAGALIFALAVGTLLLFI